MWPPILLFIFFPIHPRPPIWLRNWSAICVSGILTGSDFSHLISKQARPPAFCLAFFLFWPSPVPAPACLSCAAAAATTVHKASISGAHYVDESGQRADQGKKRREKEEQVAQSRFPGTEVVSA